MLFTVVSFIIFIILKLFFGIKVTGTENIPKKGAFILASNHASYLDPPILGPVCYMYTGRKVNFLAKEELFNNKIFAWLISELNAFPIKRSSVDIGAIKESLRRIKRGQPLVVFPEGGRSPSGKIQEGFPGIALLAKKTEVPIVPVFIKGSDCALGAGAKSLKFCRISVNFGKPIIFHKSDALTYPEITDKIMSSIKNSFPRPPKILDNSRF